LAAAIVAGPKILHQILDWMPPSGLVLLSCFVIQTSMVGAKTLFVPLGVIGTIFMCKVIAALILLWMERAQLKKILVAPRPYRDYALVLGLGIAMALMNIAIYSAIARIPMGVASMLEFMGPLGLAVLGSRRLLHLLWVGLATGGVVLLNPGSHASLDGLGVGLALLAGGGWAAYILLSGKVGKAFPGKVGLALAMTIAALILSPFGIPQMSRSISPETVFLGLLVASLGTLLPYSLEYAALKRMPSRIFGTLMSVEPAIAAIVGFLFLQEVLSLQTLVAILLVTIAAAGSSLSEPG
jgi:inner membrane transporter RhtA